METEFFIRLKGKSDSLPAACCLLPTFEAPSKSDIYCFHETLEDGSSLSNLLGTESVRIPFKRYNEECRLGAN
eukprot:scaffold10020_cov161-Skeletonema_marinoi.AAC.5